MSQSDRIGYYLAMAKDLRGQAARCGDPDTAAAYLELAVMWVRLAEDAGVTAANDAEPDADAQREA